MPRARDVAYRCLDTDCGHEFRAGPGPTICPICGGLYVGRLEWFALMTQARAEAAVRDRLKAAGYETLFLHYRVPVRRANRLSRRQREAVALAEKPEEVMLRPCLPRYLFVRLTPAADFYGIATLPGVSTFLRSETRPRTVPDADIERLKEWGDEDGCIPLEEEPAPRREERFEAGLVVRIKGDTFEGVGAATVARDDGNMVAVYADMFGRRTEIVLAPEMLEVA